MRETFTHRHKRLLAVLLTLIISSAAVATPSPDDKLKPEDVVAKHLASIGPADALAAAKARVMIGRSRAITRTNAVKELAGPAQLASDGDKVLLAMLFNSTTYPYEKIGYDGQKMTTALLETSGRRSALGDFLMSNDAVFKQGLIGGVLSSAWPLLDLSAKNPKLSYSGTKKVDNRLVHELKYVPRKGSDLRISLFFDAETFQHVRTEYQHSVSARMGPRPGSSVQSGSTDTGGAQNTNRYKLTEEFSDFRTEDKLTLPHTYTIRYSIDEANNTQILEWVITFSQFAFNQSIDAAAFNVAASK